MAVSESEKMWEAIRENERTAARIEGKLDALLGEAAAKKVAEADRAYMEELTVVAIWVVRHMIHQRELVTGKNDELTVNHFEEDTSIFAKQLWPQVVFGKNTHDAFSSTKNIPVTCMARLTCARDCQPAARDKIIAALEDAGLFEGIKEQLAHCRFGKKIWLKVCVCGREDPSVPEPYRIVVRGQMSWRLR